MKDAVTNLRNIVEPLRLLEHYNAINIVQHGNEIRCSCPIHKGDNPTAFVFNTENKLWYCHTHCHTGGDIYDLVMQIEGVDFKEAVQRIAEIFNINISDMIIQIRSNQTILNTRTWIKTMHSIMDLNDKTIKPFDITMLGDLKRIKSYRQFNAETLNHFNVQYCVSNKRVLIPIYIESQLIGVTMRKTNNHPIKWLHQPSGLNIGSFIYNQDDIIQNQPLIICEGVFDVLNYWQNGYKNVIATFGCHITAKQERTILLSTSEIILSFDNDDAGVLGTLNSIEMLKSKLNIKIARLPQGFDPGQLTQEQTHDAINNAMKIYQWKNK